MRAAAFDRLSPCAAVLDSDGVIVDTNRAWRLFAELNEGSVRTTGIGVNYLDVCDRAADAGVSISGEVAAGLRRILNGERHRSTWSTRARRRPKIGGSWCRPRRCR